MNRSIRRSNPIRAVSLSSPKEKFARVVVRRVLPETPAAALRALFSPAQHTDSLRILRGGEILNLALTARRVI